MTRRNGTVTDDVADALLDSYQAAPAGMQHLAAYELPSAEQVARVVDQCRGLLFPGFAGAAAARLNRTELRDLVRERVDELRNSLRRQVYRGLNHRQQVKAAQAGGACPSCAVDAEAIVDRFIEHLPELRAALAKDVRAAFEGDPAATGADEILVCYPGFYAITVYRIAHELLRAGAVIVPRMMTELAHERTGIDIHPGATVGESVFIEHGTGGGSGEPTVIGDRVRGPQGVDQGALSVPRTADRPSAGARRHPTIEDDVVIYAGATILGGDTVIGTGAVIGGNAWVTGSVAPGSRVAGAVSRRPEAT